MCPWKRTIESNFDFSILRNWIAAMRFKNCRDDEVILLELCSQAILQNTSGLSPRPHRPFFLCWMPRRCSSIKAVLYGRTPSLPLVMFCLFAKLEDWALQYAGSYQWAGGLGPAVVNWAWLWAKVQLSLLRAWGWDPEIPDFTCSSDIWGYFREAVAREGRREGVARRWLQVTFAGSVPGSKKSCYTPSGIWKDSLQAIGEMLTWAIFSI